MDPKKRSRIQEDLPALYLRLNGFFVTGFIVHSPIHGQIETEVDLLAVRFPRNLQPEREVEPDLLLEVSDRVIDLAICEVKSKGRQLHFKALYRSPDSIACILRWAGMVQEFEIEELAVKLQTALSPESSSPNTIPCVDSAASARVRGLLCSPERDAKRSNQAWFLSGGALLDFISRCLCSAAPRPECATTSISANGTSTKTSFGTSRIEARTILGR